MQAMRDAVILAVLGLALMTVRVDRVPAPVWNAEPSRSGATPTATGTAAADRLAVEAVRFASPFGGGPEAPVMPVLGAISEFPDDHEQCACLDDQLDLAELIDGGREMFVLVRQDAPDRATPPPAAPRIKPVGRDCT